MTEQQEATTQDDRAWQATPDMVVLTIVEQAKTFYSQGRLGRTRELLEKVLKMRPKAAATWAFLGVVHRREDRLVNALQCLQRAAELDPSDRNALVNLGEVLVIAGKIPEGAAVLRAVFDMGFVKGKPPQEHDQLTKRAGAQLAMIQKILESPD